MKIAVVGDIHLSLRGKDNQWELDRFESLFDILAAEDVNRVLINGDIFDKSVPTLMEIAAFYDAVNKIKTSGKECFVIDGNHEELSSKKTTFDFLPHTNFTHLKLFSEIISGVEVWYVGHPYIQALNNGSVTPQKPSILFSHYRSDIGFAKEEVSNSKVSSMFSHSVLSDIHYRLSPAENIEYTSSPYGIHFSPEKEYGYVVVDINDGDYSIEFKQLHLPSKIKLQVEAKDLETAVQLLDDTNKYNIEVLGEENSDFIKLLKNKECVEKFSFISEEEDIEDIKDDIILSTVNSVTGIIEISLEDLELTDEEKNAAKRLLREVIGVN